MATVMTMALTLTLTIRFISITIHSLLLCYSFLFQDVLISGDGTKMRLFRRRM